MTKETERYEELVARGQVQIINDIERRLSALKAWFGRMLRRLQDRGLLPHPSA